MPTPCSCKSEITSNSTTFSASVSEAVGSSKMTALASNVSARAFHHMRGCDREVAHTRSGIEPDLELLQDRVGLGFQFDPVHQSEPFSWQFSKIDILGHTEFVCEAEFLMDEDNALGFCVQRAGHDHRFLVHDNLAFVRLVNAAKHLHQGGFSGAIFTHQGMHFARQNRK